MGKLPYLPFYPGDWWRDAGVQSLTLEEKGAWFEMLLLMHDSEKRGYLLVNSSPIGAPVLGKLLGISSQKGRAILERLKQLGVCSVDKETKAIYCRKMVNDEELRKVKAKSGKKGGKKRISNVLKQKSSKASSKTQAGPETEYEEVLREWNRNFKDEDKVPSVVVLNQDRKQSIRTRFKNKVFKSNYKLILEKIKNSDYLCFRYERYNGSEWTPDFDWVFANDKNWVKILEGKYDNKNGVVKEEKSLTEQAAEYEAKQKQESHG